MTVIVEVDVRGLVELERKLANEYESFDAAVRRALAIVGQRGFDWLQANAPELSGLYKRSVTLEIAPNGDVALAVGVRYARAVEKRTGTFNRMKREVMSSKHIAAEVSRQLKLIQ